MKRGTWKQSSKRSKDCCCVEVRLYEKTVAVRNSEDERTIVDFSHEEWRAFVEGVKNGEFDA